MEPSLSEICAKPSCAHTFLRPEEILEGSTEPCWQSGKEQKGQGGTSGLAVALEGVNSPQKQLLEGLIRRLQRCFSAIQSDISGKPGDSAAHYAVSQTASRW